MLSYIYWFFKRIFTNNTENYDDDDGKEDFLAEQLLDLEVSSVTYETDIEQGVVEIPRNADCFQRTGLISYINDSENYVLIDGMLYYDTSCCFMQLNVNDKVLYLAYKDKNESIIVARILENYGLHWGDEDLTQEDKFKVIQHIIVGEVDFRKERYVYMKGSDLKFSLNDVEGAFIPVKGDWLELNCTIQWDEDKPSDVSATQVLKIISFKPLRSKIKHAVVTEWSGDCGSCDRTIFFNKQTLQADIELQVGSKVTIEAIESNQGTCPWRAVKLIASENLPVKKDNMVKLNEEELSLNLEKEKNIDITYPLKFVDVQFDQQTNIMLHITNKSDNIHTVNKWIVLSKKRDSQIEIKPFVQHPLKLHPNETISFTIKCCPKFLGSAKECLLIMFKGFQCKRFIEINVSNNNLKNFTTNNNNNLKTEYENIQNMRKIRKYSSTYIPGERPIKPPAFVPLKLGNFPIPNKIWSVVIGDSEMTAYTSDYDKILERIESQLPCLSQDLVINNYTDKWHTLLYMEEIQANISMRSHDISKAFLTRCQEYLGIEIFGLSEKRPSLIKGDRAIAKDIWNTDASQYEGYIHCIKGDLVLMKFNPQFHETYSGSDVSIEFHFSRTVYRRAHQAVNLAISNLGPDILFPSRVLSQSPLLTSQKTKSIEWFNQELNSNQKTAIINILLGECRPLPYVIYGPPGTGKTVTVIESILQILTLFPDSRILVATPSNSASNLITERLIQYKNAVTSSIIRLIANHLLDSDNIPDSIKPFCATLDITKEDTAKSRYNRNKNGVNINCRTSFIGRHRVTIGTCSCLGTLSQMGLPRGHFTHIIVDEAGQATEPEIMIPLSFIDKETGQIILAGDPMQLGPVIMSKYCKEFGMDDSYLNRILETFPYQRDYEAYTDGFNNKLVTKLNNNYRSLQEVLKLPSEMFYDGSLVPKINRSQPWILRILNVISEIYDMENNRSGGIFVYGIKGCNARAVDSPSWYNPQEGFMVALTTCKLYKKSISADEIGIITPYIAQIKYIKLLFESMGLPQPKVGTVEEFQGQERPIILVSTVRSTESYLDEDRRHALGFVKNPKRLNVALTRAQVVVILFCNPHLLCKDTLWNKVIMQAVEEEKYMGCDLPYD